MAAYQTYTQDLNKSLVRVYRDGLNQLNTKLAKLWASGVPPTGDVLDALRAEVKTLVAQRQIIIKRNLPRVAAKTYNDILHQAAKLTGVDVQINQLSDAEALKLVRIRPKSVPSFESLLKAKKVSSTRNTILRAQSELKSATTLEAAEAALKTVLTVDANNIIRFTNAEATRVINNAVNMAFETMADPTSTINKLISVSGVELVKVWIHDSPAVPREYHRDQLHGSLPDEDGYWYEEDGDKADGPGGFSKPEHNMGCRCSIEVMTLEEWRSRFGESYLQSWSYLPE